ncbi:MAG: 50S ribosomal protein P1 [Candidatus Altarchaeaceae archaeon]
MKYVYAALLLNEAKLEINEENLTKVLSAVDPNVDQARIKALVEALKGINIEEVLKGASVMPVSVAPQAPAPTPTETKEKKEEKKPEKEEKKEEAEEEAAAGLAALFG